MKCPACSNELTEWQVGTIAVDVCDGGCGGVWFDAFELQKAGQASESVAQKLISVHTNPSISPDPDLKRECPRCPGSVKLSKHYFSRQSRVHVDQCPNCGGYWLDHGELSIIHQETSGRPVTHPNRPEMSMDVIRFLYRLRTANAEDSTPPPAA